MEISKESSTAEKKRRRRKRGTRERKKREREKESQTSKKLGPFLYMCFGLFAANDLAKIKHHY